MVTAAAAATITTKRKLNSYKNGTFLHFIVQLVTFELSWPNPNCYYFLNFYFSFSSIISRPRSQNHSSSKWTTLVYISMQFIKQSFEFLFHVNDNKFFSNCEIVLTCAFFPLLYYFPSLTSIFCSNGKENLGAVESSKNWPRIYIELRHVMATEIVISNCLATEISQNKRCAPISCGHWWDLFGLGLGLSLQLLQPNEFIVNKIHRQKIQIIRQLQL